MEISTTEKNKIIKKYLSDFLSSIENRSLPSLFYSNFFKSLLEWHFSVWSKEISYISDEAALGKWSEYYDIFNVINSIFDKIVSRVLSEDGMDLYAFFEQFKNHAEKNKNQTYLIKPETGDIRYYIEELMQTFYRLFFNKVDDSPNRSYIWESYFPKDWLIHATTLKDSVIQRIGLGQFLQWAEGRISSAKEKDFDRALNEVSENLFPDVYPSWWAAILTFTLLSYDPSARVKSVIERSWSFGGIGRIRSMIGFSGDTKDSLTKYDEQFRSMDKAEQEKTIEMVKVLSKMVGVFAQTFNPNSLKELIAEAEKLKFPDDPTYESRRKMLLEIFHAVSENKS